MFNLVKKLFWDVDMASEQPRCLTLGLRWAWGKEGVMAGIYRAVPGRL